MEIPKSMISELNSIQTQLKLAIQAHQIMRLKHRDEPDNYELLKNLRDVEKHIISLGEKQNCLMKWLRNELKNGSTNSALVAKTIAASLGFGKQQCNPSVKNIVTADKKCLPPPAPKINNNKSQNKGPSYNSKTQSSCGPKKKIQGGSISYRNGPNKNSSIVYGNSPRQTDSERLNAVKAEDCSHVDSYLAEKINFLSAVGLITREVLSELQNRRVERKRRSTANHTQFVYGNTWDVTTKKRKKNNYLVTNMKHDTRQTVRGQHGVENSLIPSEVEETSGSIVESHVSASLHDEEGPQSANPTIIVPVQKTELAGQPSANHDSGCSPGQLRIPGLPASLTIERVSAQTCAVCQKAGNVRACSACNVSYHLHCTEETDKCLSCGAKLTTIGDCRAERCHLQEVNTQLNSEKEELEARAAAFSVTLAVSEYGAPHQNAYFVVGRM